MPWSKPDVRRFPRTWAYEAVDADRIVYTMGATPTLVKAAGRSCQQAEGAPHGLLTGVTLGMRREETPP
jgi:hypothetical protein